ncbi:hypothetical protein HNR73_007676 [Phytomonospora endophytica]|uniref:Uncharacterized protein n=1 Tax=Phytomonospora endophytica TaxID=714109 RepID=A0A841G1H1_9ACTN|nr:hypothetical protein [Phytomonospora endophytica]
MLWTVSMPTLKATPTTAVRTKRRVAMARQKAKGTKSAMLARPSLEPKPHSR